MPGVVAPNKRSPVPLVLGAAGVSLLAALAAWNLKPSPTLPAGPVVRSILSAASTPVSVGSDFARDLAVTRDGRVVVYRSEGALVHITLNFFVGFYPKQPEHDVIGPGQGRSSRRRGQGGAAEAWCCNVALSPCAFLVLVSVTSTHGQAQGIIDIPGYLGEYSPQV